MPTLCGPIQYTGTFHELVAYKTRFSNKVILRRKAYIPKTAYKQEPQYAAMRRNSAEFAGCTIAGKMIRTALSTVMLLADQNMAPVVNRFCKAVQKQDTVHAHGERAIVFSAHRDALTSLVFTKQHLFDSVFKQRPVATLLKEKAELHIQIGDLLPGFNFHQPWEKPYFRIIASIAAIEDVYFDKAGYKINNPLPLPSASVFSDWMMAGKKMPAQSMIVKLNNPALLQDEKITLVGAIGIQMGEVGMFDAIDPVKYASTARILVAG